MPNDISNFAGQNRRLPDVAAEFKKTIAVPDLEIAFDQIKVEEPVNTKFKVNQSIFQVKSTPFGLEASRREH